MPSPRTQHLLAAILAAALVGVAWSSGLETIELDGYRATFDPGQDFLVFEGELDCSAFGGSAAVSVTETSGHLGEADYLVYQPADWNGDLVLFARGMIPRSHPAAGSGSRCRSASGRRPPACPSCRRATPPSVTASPGRRRPSGATASPSPRGCATPICWAPWRRATSRPHPRARSSLGCTRPAGWRHSRWPSRTVLSNLRVLTLR